MRIGVTTFGGDGGKSGISQYIIQILRGFAELGGPHAFDVLVYGSEEGIFLPAATHLRALRFPESLRPPLRNLLWHQTALPGWCRRGGYDVLFLPAGNRRLPLRVFCPTVGTVHDFSSLHVKGKYDPARMLYITRVLPLLIRRLTRVITVSESSKRDIVEHGGVPAERVHVIPNAVDHARYFPRDRDACAAHLQERFGIRRPYLLYVSRIEHPGKNHVRLIRAFAALKARTGIPHELVLAGSDWDRAEEVHREAAQSGWVEAIRFTGFAGGTDLPDLYGAAELLVFPSLYEGFGLPILEAMACGTAVACSSLSSMPEVVGDTGVLFDPYDEAAIATALEGLLADPLRREANAGRALARSRAFTWTAAARQTLDVLERAAGEGGR
jgi:glycosyltransferase involved in cell wall biosynthesis